MKNQVRLKRLLKATGFWKDNALILRELRHFPAIVGLAILFPLLAAVLKGLALVFCSVFCKTWSIRVARRFKLGLVGLMFGCWASTSLS